ncbi:hypothetical protein [Photobacterium leiognathi]|uniref:hypothetical protein n=1 Tax=Photobacterium leiognathi TaxID=553611 RepID=UPI000D16B72F|nr:hypothetical protein [Photobacterium leiognathi]PSW64346.1 hypothetical protein C0W88_15280 [Photobacterium leiognathi subsp. mandapamensis]
MNKKTRFFLSLFLITLSTFSIAGNNLTLELTTIKEQDIRSIHPILIGENGDTTISETIFSNEKIILDKPINLHVARKNLAETLKSFVTKTKKIIRDIKDGSIAIPNEALKNEVMLNLRNNDSFLKRTLSSVDSSEVSERYKLYATKLKGKTVIISQTTTFDDELYVSLVMSDPDNIINNSLKLNGGIKRASVENIRGIVRDLLTNDPSVKTISAHVVSPTLESNYRRIGFKDSPCD